jgi:hypothetical protein
MDGFQKTTCNFLGYYCSLEQKSLPTIQILKKSVLPKSGRSGALLGLNFRVFLLVYGQLLAAGVPIGPL